MDGSPGSRAGSALTAAGPPGCTSVFSPPSCPQEGSDVATGAASLLAGDSAAALRMEHNLFCLRKTSTHEAGSVPVKIIFNNPTDILRKCEATAVKTGRKLQEKLSN